MMVRLIDADELSNKIQDEYHGSYSEIQIAPYQIDRMIDDMPTVNTKPVVPAHWMLCEYEIGEGSNVYKCSHCGEVQVLIDGTPKDNGWRYCPHCGAKMDSNA